MRPFSFGGFMSKPSLEDRYFPSRFGDLEKHSAIYQESVETLRKLVEAEGTEAAQYAYATVVSDLIRQEWAGWNRLKLYDKGSHWCVKKLLGETCRRAICGPRDFAPLDHTSVWRREDGAFVYVSQPYGLYSSDARKIVELEDRYGIQTHVSANRSFWNAGNSLLIEWAAKAGNSGK
jgi:hypothetical protein